MTSDVCRDPDRALPAQGPIQGLVLGLFVWDLLDQRRERGEEDRGKGLVEEMRITMLSVCQHISDGGSVEDALSCLCGCLLNFKVDRLKLNP